MELAASSLHAAALVHETQRSVGDASCGSDYPPCVRRTFVVSGKRSQGIRHTIKDGKREGVWRIWEGSDAKRMRWAVYKNGDLVK